MAFKPHKIRWLLVFYDTIIFSIIAAALWLFSPNGMDAFNIVIHFAIAYICLEISRLLWKTYIQVWRFGGVQSYIRLMFASASALLVYYCIQRALPIQNEGLTRSLALFSFDLLVELAIRMMYRYCYKFLRRDTKFARFILKLISIFGATDIQVNTEKVSKIRIAIVGAGRIGTGLADELLNSPVANYLPVCFLDLDKDKISREIFRLPVYPADTVSVEKIKQMEIQEIVFAVHDWDVSKKKETYDRFKEAGFKLKTYDYPTIKTDETTSKRSLRDFNAEELLFRNPLVILDENTTAFYKDKVVLITGGGGSIGSELCRQIAKMEPKKIVILDVYENGAYDVQQELKMKYGAKLDLQVEILSICNRVALERVFASHKPNIVVMAAAHKHVPLMEHNVIEAIENNVFGTLNTVELAEKYGVDRVHMVSTDKAVNPTSIMGATKRICEMIVQSHSTREQHTTFSATRFGNVLGSAGSVIPLFKRQIANGGPVTLTDYRIIRYFMTIPEASQLVLCSASMAKNGELFVLDMGQPVKIYDLAVNMINLAGYEVGKDIEIIETGLRPGEKLYEELLVKNEELDKTENSLIFIERDKPISEDALQSKLQKLESAVASGDDAYAKQVIKEVVTTFIEKEDANKDFDGKEIK